MDSVDKYQLEAMRTANMKVYKQEKDILLNGALGLAGESGEFADLLKKHYYQNDLEHPTPLDVEHLKKELGDILWYVALVTTGLGEDMSNILQMNIDKLKARYPDGFDADKSQHRQKGDI